MSKRMFQTKHLLAFTLLDSFPSCVSLFSMVRCCVVCIRMAPRARVLFRCHMQQKLKLTIRSAFCILAIQVAI